MEKKVEVTHMENASDNILEKGSVLGSDELVQEARVATEEEHNMTFKESLRDYYPSFLWSIVMTATIIMEGYDTILMGSFMAYDSFRKQFGKEITPGNYQITAPWQSALSCASSTTIIISCLVIGNIVERFGHRKVILVNLFLMTCFLFITFFAKKVEQLLVGQIFCGIPWGCFSIVGLIYSSEISPLNFLTAWVMACWAIGQLIASGVLQGLISNTTQWLYRIPFAVQWVWVPPITIATILCPDSPYWLVRHGKYEEAEKMIKRLTDKRIHHKAKQKLNLLIYTNEVEKNAKIENSQGLKSYLECFKGANRRRTEIASIAMAAQVFAGNNFIYAPSFFFAQIGLDSKTTYNLNLGITGLAFVGTCCSFWLASQVGRRRIYLVGLSAMTICLLVIAILQGPADNNKNYAYGQVGVVAAWTVAFVLSLAPVAYTILGEVSSTRLRAQTVAIGRNFYNLIQLLAQVIQPYFINSTSLNLKGRTSYIWFGTAFLTLVWAFFRLPETKDRTYEELDILFEKGIKARDFSSYKLDLDAEEFEE